MTAAAMDGAASSTPQQLTGGAARSEVATAARATAAHPIGWQPAWALAWAARTPRGPACAPVAVWSAGDALFRDETRASPSGPHGGLTWLLRRVESEGSALDARVARQVAEEKARAERAREERRERL